MSLPGEDLVSNISKNKLADAPSTLVPQTLIKSSQLILQLDQSLIPDDPRFPRLQLEGNLPMLDLDLSEYRLLELVKLIVTLPFPKADVPDTLSPPPVLNSVIYKIYYMKNLNLS